MLKRFFSELDFFYALPTLRSRGQPQTTNLCGGILSLLLLLFFIYVFLINLVNTLNFEQMQVVQIEKKFKNGEGKISGIYFTIGLENTNYYRDIYPFSRLVAHVVHQTRKPEYQLEEVYDEILLEPCTIQHFEMFDKSQRGQIFEQYNLGDRLCPVKGQNLSIQNTYQSKYCEYIKIQIISCTGLPGCNPNPIEETKRFEPIYTSTHKYFEAVVYLIDTGFNPSEENPTFSKIQRVRGTYSTTMARQINIYLSQYQIETDFGVMPWEEMKIQKGYFMIKQYYTDYQFQAHFPQVYFTIFFSDEHKIIKRTVGKIDDVLSYAGGLFSIIISFLGFFFLSYNEYRYEIMVAEGAFNYNDDGKKLKEGDFTFIKYVKYSLYDWIQLLGCCELKWEDCEEIAGTRKEANNQLDVSLLFKKIQHLERAVEYMMSEKEEICLYLTEPPSLNEVRRKRKLSEYYDKVIQGNAAMTVEDVKIKDDFSMVLFMGMQKSLQKLELNKKPSNARFKEEIEKSRENILEHAIQHYIETHDREQDDEELDQEDIRIEYEIAESFFHMKQEKKAKIQQKIPLKILYRLQNSLNQTNERRNNFIKFE